MSQARGRGVQYYSWNPRARCAPSVPHFSFFQRGQKNTAALRAAVINQCGDDANNSVAREFAPIRVIRGRHLNCWLSVSCRSNRCRKCLWFPCCLMLRSCPSSRWNPWFPWCLIPSCYRCSSPRWCFRYWRSRLRPCRFGYVRRRDRSPPYPRTTPGRPERLHYGMSSNVFSYSGC
jgi:hypothetical protein